MFISGKNWKLSLAELAAYFKAREIKFEVQFFSKEFFAINIEKDSEALVIEDLGGTIKIGQAKPKFPTSTVKEAFLEKNKQAQSQITESLASSDIVDQMAKSAEKVLFGVSVYCAEKTLRPSSGIIQRFAGSAIKDQLADVDKKSKFMGFSKDRRFAQLSHIEVLKKN